MTCNSVLINASNLNGAGALGVGVSLVPAILQSFPAMRFRVLVPEREEYRSLELERLTPDVRYFQPYSGLRNDLERLKHVLLTIPAAASGMDLCLTLGDIGPVKLPCRHSVYLHQPLLVYDSSELCGVGWTKPKATYLGWHFQRMCKRVERLFVQTDVMAERAIQRYAVERGKVRVVPVPIPSMPTENGKGLPAIGACRKPVRLLFLARFYPHKNHAILPLVAGELRRRGMEDKVHIFVTIEESACPEALQRKLRDCADIITNLGTLSRPDAAAALRSSTAIFLPTLFESSSLVYSEAMVNGLRVLTSDRDFARWVCCDLATYFDPHDPVSIVDAIQQQLTPELPDEAYARTAAEYLKRFPASWNEVALSIGDALGFCRT